MSDSGNWRHPPVTTDPSVPLTNLTAVGTRLDSLSRYLTESVNSNTVLPNHQIDSISSELISAIHQVVINGAALLASQSPPPPQPQPQAQPEPNPVRRNSIPIADPDPKTDDDLEIVEVDAVELLAEHIHMCDICGKGFKRDANLRMHMRAHGNQYKTPEALAKPVTTTSTAAAAASSAAKKRFSCPYVGCNRNKESANFRPLKSVVCVKNHFKRSHCPRMYTCNRCNRKSFSVVGDLRSHLRVCGESKWKCSCGTSFSRKDKLFAHVALFEGHMPSFDVSPAATSTVAAVEDEEEMDVVVSASAAGSSCSVCGGGGGGGELEFDDMLEGFIRSYDMEECFRF